MGSRFTDAEKTHALSRLDTQTHAQVAADLGISERTLHRWASEAGLVPPVTDVQQKTLAARAAAAERVSRTWADFREGEALNVGALAAGMRAELRQRMEAHVEGKDLRDLAVAYGILIDKAELLSGQATSRIQVWAETELDVELRRLVAEMEETVRERGR